MKFMNTTIDNLTMNQALNEIALLVENSTRNYVVTPNVDHIVRIENDSEFREIYDNASLVLTDGQPLIWISKLLGTPIKEKISGSDLFPLVCELSAEKGYKMFFLGAAEGVADIAANKIKLKFPSISIVGTYSPEFGFERNEKSINKIITIVKEKQPDILILALGTPKQEKFYYRYKSEFDVPLALSIGASIDFEAGVVKRAPNWVSKCGLEWFFRLCQEPKRLFKRYLIEDMKIFKLIWKYR